MDGVRPYAVVILVQLIDAGMFIITKAALTFGLNPLVFIFYRHAFGTFLLAPIAMIFLRRKAQSPALSFMLLFKTFMLVLMGISIFYAIYYIGLSYISATATSAISNSLPVFTFIFAVFLRMETLKLKSRSGIVKLLGILFCVTGILIIALYKGPQLSSLNHHHIQLNNHEGNSNHESNHSITTWIKGSFLVVLSCVICSLWFICQGTLLKELQSKLHFTTYVCIFSTIQSFVIAIMFERDFTKWKLHWDMGLLAIGYSAVAVTGLSYYLQAWCVDKKGPVFLAISTPLSFVFTMIGSSFILGEQINMGSALGGISMVAGLYSVLWGKSMETKVPQPSIVIECSV
ncbi:WAT1-related protein At5g64700-like [Dioscorea cayenensis subsp. rotundata]|uniref:WAT1-related protein n=1 Tax=Dioscorea cayennensis subsp. rotundata TaxID=55577 RepID=A0AB40C1V1_DIOCR|nr:WAT1-related protein At5g64700-like [Dioscorea cayenensis subsp. rotundata]